MKKILFSIIFALLFCSFSYAQENRPLKILEKPKPTYPEIEGTVHIQGTITLRVEFRADGTVGKIDPVSTLPYGFTEQAVEAAKKIKFEPAIQDSEPKTIFRLVQYNLGSIGWQDSSLNKSNELVSLSKTDEQAEAILKKAVEKLGGERYKNVKSQIGKGKFSQMRDGQVFSFQSFVDVIVFPDKERTEFKGGGGGKTIQTNFGGTGWVYDGSVEVLNDQSPQQIENFQQGMRVSLDNLLRGYWRKQGAKLEYVGKRPARIGYRNDVVKLTFEDGFAVEFEFADDGTPSKSVYKRANSDEEIIDEDRYAQFVEIQGIKTPFIIDRFSNGKHTSRINFESIEFNKSIPDSIFSKPANMKDLKKDLKL